MEEKMVVKKEVITGEKTVEDCTEATMAREGKGEQVKMEVDLGVSMAKLVVVVVVVHWEEVALVVLEAEYSEGALVALMAAKMGQDL